MNSKERIQAELKEYATWLRIELNLRLLKEYGLLHPQMPNLWVSEIEVTLL